MPELSVAKVLFQRTVRLEAAGQPAKLRPGFVGLQQRDFAGAALHLEAAYRANPALVGRRKALGYNYVWLGQLKRAEPLLAGIPEAAAELGLYATWWVAQGRGDLAERASLMAVWLQGGGP